MSAPTVLALLADTINYLTDTPLIGGGENELEAPTAATVYGSMHPGDDDDTRYARFASDGSQVQYDMPSALEDIPADSGPLATIDHVKAIVLRTDDYKVKTPLTRIADSGAPSGDEWTRNSATQIEIAAALPKGQVLEVIVPETITTLTGGALTANRKYNTQAYDFMVATALANLTGLTR